VLEGRDINRNVKEKLLLHKGGRLEKRLGRENDEEALLSSFVPFVVS